MNKKNSFYGYTKFAHLFIIDRLWTPLFNSFLSVHKIDVLVLNMFNKILTLWTLFYGKAKFAMPSRVLRKCRFCTPIKRVTACSFIVGKIGIISLLLFIACTKCSFSQCCVVTRRDNTDFTDAIKKSCLAHARVLCRESIFDHHSTRKKSRHSDPF